MMHDVCFEFVSPLGRVVTIFIQCLYLLRGWRRTFYSSLRHRTAASLPSNGYRG